MKKTSEQSDFYDLLPEYVQGRLSPDQERAFSEVLNKDPDLQKEVQEWSSLTERFLALDDQEEAAPEHIFARVEENINKADQAQFARLSKEPPGSSLPSRLAIAWENLRRTLWAPWALAAVQAVVIVLLLLPAGPQNTYTTLSRPTEAETPAVRPLFNVVFQPSARESEIRALLLSVNGDILAGPSAQGRYVVAITGGTSADEIQAMLEQSAIVLFVDRAL